MPSLPRSLLVRLVFRNPCLAPESRKKVWRKEDSPLVKEDWVRDHLSKLGTHKSVVPDGMHPRVLRELADVIARPLSIIFERIGRSGEVPVAWKKASAPAAFQKGKKEEPGNCRPVSLPSIPGKVMEPLLLDAISKHVEDKKVTGSSQRGFTQGKSCLTNLLAFSDGMTGWVDEGRAEDVVSLDLSKAFDAVCHPLLKGELRRRGLYEWTVRWIEKWLDGRAPRVVVSGAKSGWMLVTRLVSQGSVLGPALFSFSLMTWRKGQSAPSASWLVILNWEEWLTHQRAVLPLRGTWTGWRVGRRGTS
ncbi:tetraspanin-9 isoform X2 [Struthio camelus]|uniref:tetraspanin-9 isoform X2 n=1 Tax=Struthio camelus TaxID=8801 RepID=UPI003604084D